MTKIHTLITAHSGAEGTEPNSLEFIEKTLQDPSDAFEVDVREAPEGYLYLAHDASPDPEAEVRLERAFWLLKEQYDRGGRKRINCDLKSPGIEGKVYELAAAQGLVESVILSGAVRVPEPGKAYGALTFFYNVEGVLGDLVAFSELEEGAKREWMGRMDEVAERMPSKAKLVWNMPYLFYEVNRDVLLGRKCSLWTLRSEAELEQYVGEVEAVTTMLPIRACELRENLGATDH